MATTNRTPQILLLVMVLVFSIMLIVLQSVRRYKMDPKNPQTRRDLTLWLCELLTALCLIVLVVVNFFLYWSYIPADSPGCLPYISQFGIIASSADPGAYATNPKTTYPATSYPDAIIAYRKSPNGLATGYFSWDGLAITILNSNAHELRTGAPPGTSWVFQDLSTAVSH